MCTEVMPTGVCEEEKKARLVCQRPLARGGDGKGRMKAYAGWDLPVVEFHHFGGMGALKTAADAVGESDVGSDMIKSI